MNDGGRADWDAPPAPVTVLGVGNPVMADDGAGLELLARVRDRRPDPRVGYVDGGTAGMELVPVVTEATRLLVLDAVAGPTPGRVRQFSGDQLPRLLSATLSPHQVSLLDVFAAARLLDHEPEQIAVVGIVPEVVEMRVGLSGPVTGALGEAVAAAVAVLDGWLAELDGQP